jgi:hypothetical protein
MHNSFSASRATLVGLAVLASMASAGFSAEVGLNFTAQINFVGIPNNGSQEVGKTYGVRLEPFSMFSGHIVYESNTPGVPLVASGCTDCTTYLHKQINGLHVDFPGLTLQADEYLVQVKNDVNVSSVGPADVLGIWYPDQTDPASPKMKPALINGSPVSAGSFRMELVVPQTTFATSQLPETVDPAAFMEIVTAGIVAFGDGLPYYYLLDLYGKPQSVSAFPHSTSDHDLDGDSDGQDFLIWQRSIGQTTGDGDADSNLLVDEHDLEMWRAEYGVASSELTAAVAVPEPTTIVFMIGASLVGLLRR